MLSKTEREYLEGKIKPTRNYEYKLLFSIRKKLLHFYKQDLPLIESKAGVIGGATSYLGKLTSYQAKLTPPAFDNLIMIKYLNHIMFSWMHVALNAKK